MKFFDAVKEEMGDVPIIAEDLGVFGEDVTQLLDKTRFPGMRVIQFGFDPCGNSTHLPHNYPLNTVRDVVLNFRFKFVWNYLCVSAP